MSRFLWTALGVFFVVLAVIGVITPVMPTTPFLLLACKCFVKSSPRLHRMLLESKLFGPFLRDWEQHHAVRPWVKPLAILMMLVAVTTGLVTDYLPTAARVVLVILAAIGIGVVARLKVIRD